MRMEIQALLTSGNDTKLKFYILSKEPFLSLQKYFITWISPLIPNAQEFESHVKHEWISVFHLKMFSENYYNIKVTVATNRHFLQLPNMKGNNFFRMKVKKQDGQVYLISFDLRKDAKKFRFSSPGMMVELFTQFIPMRFLFLI